jgi:transcriptional regulator with XRE-family HTH domain
MENPSELLRAARRAAGLSASALAAKAQVPTSTVTRIEKGATDPTFGMLARLLDAAGHQLVVSTRARDDAPMALASLTSAATSDEDRLRIDWTRLRAFADWADRHPNEVSAAITDPPLRTGTVFDAILAAFAEVLAARAGVDPPRWTRSVPISREPWAPPGTPAMRARAAEATPDAFRRRNIVLSRDAIFRDAA